MAVAKIVGTDPMYLFSKASSTSCITGCYFDNGLEVYGTSLEYFPLTLDWAQDSVTDTAAWKTAVWGDANYHVVGARRSSPSNTVVLFVDGQTKTATLDSDDVTVPGYPAVIGAIHYGNLFSGDSVGYIAELVVVHGGGGGVIADHIPTDLYAYFKWKYAL
jgi:hypothetical protein